MEGEWTCLKSPCSLYGNRFKETSLHLCGHAVVGQRSQQRYVGGNLQEIGNAEKVHLAEMCQLFGSGMKHNTADGLFTKPSTFLHVLYEVPQFREDEFFAGKLAGLETAGNAKDQGLTDQACCGPGQQGSRVDFFIA